MVAGQSVVFPTEIDAVDRDLLERTSIGSLLGKGTDTVPTDREATLEGD